MSASVFGSAHSVLHSAGFSVLKVGLVAFIAIVFCASVNWVFQDARRRIADRRLVALATLLACVPPFLGPLVYMLLRPPEYLEDVRERELEIKAIETRLGGPDIRCSVCGSGVEPDYLVCPVCTTRLRSACAYCRRPLEVAWQVCPYCETPVEDASPLAAAPLPQTAVAAPPSPALSLTETPLAPRPARSPG